MELDYYEVLGVSRSAEDDDQEVCAQEQEDRGRGDSGEPVSNRKYAESGQG